MLSPEEKKQIHRLETDLLIEEERKRHLLLEDHTIIEEERSLHTTLVRTEQALGKTKAERSRIEQLLRMSEEAIQRLKIKIKGLRN